MSDQPFQPRISAKQARILNTKSIFNLVTGPRKASKSWGVLNAIPWHMWNTQDSVGMMLGQSTTQNLDAGLWPLLVDRILPAWIEGHIYDRAGNVIDQQPFGMEWVTMPKMHPITHKVFFSLTNKFGGVSTFYLESLDVEDHVERYKNKVYDLIVGTEFSNFVRRKTFDILKNCFRGRPREDCRMFLDQNPPKEGEESWSFLLFYWFRTVDLDTADPEVLKELGLDTVPEEKRPRMIKALKQLQADLNVIEFSVDDNEFISQEEKDGVYADHAHDPDLLARYFYGKYVKASGEGIFREVWRPQLHLIGDLKTPANPNPEMMIPEEDCVELGSGSDLGRRNSAIVIFEPITVMVEERNPEDPSGESKIEVPKIGFKFLSEYNVLGKQQKLDDIAAWWLQQLDEWESYCKHVPLWTHISDHSAFSQDLKDERDESKEIYRLTKGRVELQSVVGPYRKNIKGHGSVEASISLMQRLLLEGRILVSAPRCPNLSSMFGSMARGKNGKLSPTNLAKHIFDAARYPVMARCWNEMIMTPRNRTTEDAKIIVTTL